MKKIFWVLILAIFIFSLVNPVYLTAQEETCYACNRDVFPHECVPDPESALCGEAGLELCLELCVGKEPEPEGQSCVECPTLYSYHTQTQDCCATGGTGICDPRYGHRPATFLDNKCGEGLSCSRKTGTCVKTEDLPLFGPQCCSIVSGDPYECAAIIDEQRGIQTALGCFPTHPQAFVSWLFKYGISIAGGIAFLMIIFSAFQMITSSGDPEKLQKAKQMLGSAIAGLIFIIFAVFLLRIIGVEILKIL